MAPFRREGLTVGEIIRNHDDYAIINSDDEALSRGSNAKIWLSHKCLDGETRKFEMYVHKFSAGQGCPPCGYKLSGYKRSLPKKLEDSLLYAKEGLLEKNIRIVESDDILRNTKAHSHKKVKCACEAGKGHENWYASSTKLIRGTGCPECGREKQAIAVSTPPSFETSLAALLNRLENRKYGILFLHLANENDKRRPYQLFPMSHEMAVWRCICCGRDWKASINEVVRRSSCPDCSGAGTTEKMVSDYIKGAYNKFIPQYQLGTYKTDFRVWHRGVPVDVEVDGSPHYDGRLRYSNDVMSFEKQIARDVEKMRRSSSEIVPTVRIPTAAVSRDIRTDGEHWKRILDRAIDDAALAAIRAGALSEPEANVPKISTPSLEDMMFIVEGHREKYIYHSSLLECINRGDDSVSVRGMTIIPEISQS